MFTRRGYLLEITNRVPKKRTLFGLADVLARYRYTEFRPYSTNGFAALDLGKLDAYCRMQGLELIPTDRAAFDALLVGGGYVCASTEAPRSLAGRVEEMRERMAKTEANGRLHNIPGFLVTDFSDGFEWHPPVVSLPGVILGGLFATGGAKAARMDLERELNGVLSAPVGGLLLKLGTLYLRGGAVRDDASEYFNILAHDRGYSRHPGLTDYVLDEVGGIAEGIRIAAERWADRSDRAAEIAYAARLIDCACHRRDERRLRELRDEHGRLWRLAMEEDGRVESLARLPRF